MLREVLLSVMLLGLLGIAVHASAAPAVGWSASLSGPVAQGSLMVIQILGPPDGNYSVAVDVQPFNSTTPVLMQYLTMPSYAALSNGSALGEARVPTTNLGAEMVQVVLSNNSTGEFAMLYVQIQPGGPELAALSTQVQQLQFDLNENASRLQSLLYLRQEVQNWAIFAVAWSSALAALLFYAMFATRSSARERRFLHVLGKIPKKRTYIETDWVKEEPLPVLLSDGTSLFVLNPPVCETCRVPQQRSQLRRHAAKHRLPPEEIEARIVPSEEAEREARQVIEASRRGRPSARGEFAGERPGVDLTGLTED